MTTLYNLEVTDRQGNRVYSQPGIELPDAQRMADRVRSELPCGASRITLAEGHVAKKPIRATPSPTRFKYPSNRREPNERVAKRFEAAGDHKNAALIRELAT